ncbi:flagellar basal body rod protein FlgB [Paenibacillus ginsengihumi]|jgi:flagellar basal-body rod protein FlgB|uniref:flagellar basal body rod protein FlgB n=1 Tax=Paenibacillus ginsengihumi TaxID=431596 RepID=UPI00037A0E55|nr:flagellar basal body rod protein FlgB [Paenibacillus ginsengihumi]
MDIFNKPALQLVERSLDAAALRQRVIADNVANVDTPNFKRSEVQFEELLRQEMNGSLVGYRTDPRHIPIGEPGLALPRVVQDTSTIVNNNLNNVDIDYEMSLMALNQLRYNTMIEQVSGTFNKLRTSIGGRG